jgi:hypothetical protein
MKKNIFCKTIVFFVLALVFSCSQDPIFFTISTEPRPVKPRIPGGPTNMVAFNNRMYVASGKLFSYNGASGWDDNLQPGGKVIGLASTGDHLYALCLTGSGVDTVLRRLEPGGWADIGNAESTYTLIQSIYADNDSGELFAGAMNNKGDYGILYLKDSLSATPSLGLIAGDTEMLSGAASRTEGSETVYFLSTKGRGVYTISQNDLTSNTPATQLGGSENRLLMGMIKLTDDSGSDAIIVIERNNGTFFEVRKEGFRTLTYSNGVPVISASGKYATGALAEWVNVDNKSQKMLIAGIQGDLYSTSTTSSYSHGYVEIELDSPFNTVGGWLVLNIIRSTNPDITVGGNTGTDRYTATIGKHPVNHFFQTPESIDPNRIFFASTQTAGLWSYRHRDGGWQWNAEK